MRYYQSACSTFVKKFIQTSRAISFFHEKKVDELLCMFLLYTQIRHIYFKRSPLPPFYSLIKINRHLRITEMRNSHYMFVNIFCDFLFYMRFARLILSTTKQVAVLRQNVAIQLLQLSQVLNYPLFCYIKKSIVHRQISLLILKSGQSRHYQDPGSQIAMTIIYSIWCVY